MANVKNVTFDLYTALHDIVAQIEKGEKPETINMEKANKALHEADKIKMLRELRYVA